MANPPSPSKSDHWTEIVREYRRSGLTQVRFCREHDISYHSLRWWVRRLGGGRPDDTSPRRMPPAALKPPMPEATRFLPVRIIEDDTDRFAVDRSRDAPPPIQVILDGGHRIAVGPGFAPDVLRRVVVALEVPGC